MYTTSFGAIKVKLYDDIEQMPMCRFHKYNKFMLIDSGIGSDIRDMDNRLARLTSMVKLTPDKAVTELLNMRMGLHLIGQEISPKFMAYAALIAEVDGVPTTDLSDEGLKKVLELLKTAPVGVLWNTFDKVKKKFKMNSWRTSLQCIIKSSIESGKN